MDDEKTPTDRPPKPAWAPRPYPDGLGPEPISGLFHVQTGRTRKFAKYGAIIGALVTLLMPIAQALAVRIAPAPVDVRIERELLELRDMLRRDGGV